MAPQDDPAAVIMEAASMSTAVVLYNPNSTDKNEEVFDHVCIPLALPRCAGAAGAGCGIGCGARTPDDDGSTVETEGGWPILLPSCGAGAAAANYYCDAVGDRITSALDKSLDGTGSICAKTTSTTSPIVSGMIRYMAHREDVEQGFECLLLESDQFYTVSNNKSTVRTSVIASDLVLTEEESAATQQIGHVTMDKEDTRSGAEAEDENSIQSAKTSDGSRSSRKSAAERVMEKLLLQGESVQSPELILLTHLKVPSNPSAASTQSARSSKKEPASEVQVPEIRPPSQSSTRSNKTKNSKEAQSPELQPTTLSSTRNKNEELVVSTNSGGAFSVEGTPCVEGSDEVLASESPSKDEEVEEVEGNAVVAGYLSVNGVAQSAEDDVVIVETASLSQCSSVAAKDDEAVLLVFEDDNHDNEEEMEEEEEEEEEGCGLDGDDDQVDVDDDDEKSKKTQQSQPHPPHAASPKFDADDSVGTESELILLTSCTNGGIESDEDVVVEVVDAEEAYYGEKGAKADKYYGDVPEDEEEDDEEVRYLQLPSFLTEDAVAPTKEFVLSADTAASESAATASKTPAACSRGETAIESENAVEADDNVAPDREGEGLKSRLSMISGDFMVDPMTGENPAKPKATAREEEEEEVEAFRSSRKSVDPSHYQYQKAEKSLEESIIESNDDPEANNAKLASPQLSSEEDDPSSYRSVHFPLSVSSSRAPKKKRGFSRHYSRRKPIPDLDSSNPRAHYKGKESVDSRVTDLVRDSVKNSQADEMALSKGFELPSNASRCSARSKGSRVSSRSSSKKTTKHDGKDGTRFQEQQNVVSVSSDAEKSSCSSVHSKASCAPSCASSKKPTKDEENGVSIWSEPPEQQKGASDPCNEEKPDNTDSPCCSVHSRSSHTPPRSPRRKPCPENKNGDGIYSSSLNQQYDVCVSTLIEAGGGREVPVAGDLNQVEPDAFIARNLSCGSDRSAASRRSARSSKSHISSQSSRRKRPDPDGDVSSQDNSKVHEGDVTFESSDKASKLEIPTNANRVDEKDEDINAQHSGGSFQNVNREPEEEKREDNSAEVPVGTVEPQREEEDTAGPADPVVEPLPNNKNGNSSKLKKDNDIVRSKPPSPEEAMYRPRKCHTVLIRYSNQQKKKKSRKTPESPRMPRQPSSTFE